MKEIRNEMYMLMGKYLTHEASAHERLVLENMLNQNEELMTAFVELRQYYQLKEVPEFKDPGPAFEKLTIDIQRELNL